MQHQGIKRWRIHVKGRNEDTTSRAKRLGEWAVLAIALWRVAGVWWTIIVSNDGIGYLQRAPAPFSEGFVTEGYRQAGYPAWLWLVDHLPFPPGFDRLFTIAVTQRLVVVLVVIVVWRVFRLWSIPLLWILTSTDVVIYSNFVLNESLTIPLGALAAALLVGAASSVAPMPGVVPPRRPGLWIIACIFVVAFTTVLKLQYILLGLPILPVLWALTPLETRVKPILAIGMATTTLLGIMMVGQAVENSRELNDFTPVSEQAHAEWWGAYYSVFKLSPSMAERPELQEFKLRSFADFYFPLLDEVPDYQERREIVDAHIDDMFVAAGTTRRTQHIEPFLGALQGGRHSDLQAMFVRLDGGADPMRQTTMSLDESPQAVLDSFNDGQPPKSILPGPLLSATQRPVEKSNLVYPLFSVVSLAMCALGVRLRPRIRWVGPTMVLSVVAVSALLATGYIDIQRYLLPYFLATTGVGTWALAADLTSRRSKGPAVTARE